VKGSQKHPNSRARIIAACVIGALAVLFVTHLILARGGGGDASEHKPKPVLVETAIAVVRPVDTVVSAQGTLVPSQGFCARVAAPSGGRLASVSVREGDRVKAGQALAVVDSRVQTAQAQSAASALRVSELQAKQAKLAAQAARSDQANAVEVARLELDMAQTELAKLKNGARPQEIAQAEQTVKQAQATRDRAATEIERAQVLYDKGVAPKRQLDDARTALSVADCGRCDSSVAQPGRCRRSGDSRRGGVRLPRARSLGQHPRRGRHKDTDRDGCPCIGDHGSRSDVCRAGD